MNETVSPALGGMLATALLFLFAISPVQAATPIHILINGTPLQTSAPPQQQNGRVLVPLRATFEALGAQVEYSDGQITSQKGEQTMSLRLGEKSMLVNGKKVALDVAAQEKNGSTLVPVRAIADAYGCSVNWDDTERQVSIFSFVSSGQAVINYVGTNIPDFGKLFQIQPQWFVFDYFPYYACYPYQDSLHDQVYAYIDYLAKQGFVRKTAEGFPENHFFKDGYQVRIEYEGGELVIGFGLENCAPVSEQPELSVGTKVPAYPGYQAPDMSFLFGRQPVGGNNKDVFIYDITDWRAYYTLSDLLDVYDLTLYSKENTVQADGYHNVYRNYSLQVTLIQYAQDGRSYLKVVLEPLADLYAPAKIPYFPNSEVPDFGKLIGIEPIGSKVEDGRNIYNYAMEDYLEADIYPFDLSMYLLNYSVFQATEEEYNTTSLLGGFKNDEYIIWIYEFDDIYSFQYAKK